MADAAQRLILIVEDDPPLGAMYRSFFADDRVVIAASAAEALRAMGEEQPDLVILDYGLNYSNAGEFVSRVAELPLTVVVSGHPQAAEFARSIGAPLVRKPFEIGYLEEVIERARVARSGEACHVE